MGIDSISLNPDSVLEVTERVAEAEDETPRVVLREMSDET